MPVSVIRKTLGLLLSATFVAVLAAVLLPAAPASAAPECRWEIDPGPDCPPMVPRPPAPPTMRPGPPGMTPMPDPGPTMPGEVCRQLLVRNGLFIRESGRQDKLIYSLDVDTKVCRRNGVVTSPNIRSEITPFNGDSRITRISSTSTAFQSGVGTNSFVQREQVFFTACGDPFNAMTCQNFRHFVDIEADGLGNISAIGGLGPFNGPLPI